MALFHSTQFAGVNPRLNVSIVSVPPVLLANFVEGFVEPKVSSCEVAVMALLQCLVLPIEVESNLSNSALIRRYPLLWSV